MPAVALWWASFGRAVRPLGGEGPLGADGRRGLVAVGQDGAVIGVAGLRDVGGGWLRLRPGLLDPLFRPAPPTDDLVIDGIAVAAAHRRHGVGQALVAGALARAAQGGHPGLRAEVARRNAGAVRFWQAAGFVETGRGRFGWPWGGPVLLMRRDAVAGAAVAEGLAPGHEKTPAAWVGG